MPQATAVRAVPVKKHRKNWSLPDATVDTIRAIRERTDAATETEVIKRAVRIYDHILRNQDDGGHLVLKDENGRDMPFMVV